MTNNPNDSLCITVDVCLAFMVILFAGLMFAIIQLRRKKNNASKYDVIFNSEFTIPELQIDLNDNIDPDMEFVEA
jgi:hypothetical protein